MSPSATSQCALNTSRGQSCSDGWSSKDWWLWARMSYVCVCHTHSTGGQCPQQEGHVVRGKQTTDFLECLWAFWLTGTSPEKGIMSEHGIPNERWLWNTRVFDLEGALLHEEWDLALPARTAFSVCIFSKLLLPVFWAHSARSCISLSDARRVGVFLCVTPVVPVLQGSEPESHLFFRVCFLWKLMEIS